MEDDIGGRKTHNPIQNNTIGLDVDKPGSAFDFQTSTLSMCSNVCFVFLFQSLNLQSSDCCSLTSIQQSSVAKLMSELNWNVVSVVK